MESEEKPTLRERIANGECVSEYTTDHCPVCVDTCEASKFRTALRDLKSEAGISPDPNQ